VLASPSEDREPSHSIASGATDRQHCLRLLNNLQHLREPMPGKRDHFPRLHSPQYLHQSRLLRSPFLPNRGAQSQL
jgi:hypothetical protein